MSVLRQSHNSHEKAENDEAKKNPIFSFQIEELPLDYKDDRIAEKVISVRSFKSGEEAASSGIQSSKISDARM